MPTSCAAGFFGNTERKPLTWPWTKPTITTRIGLLLMFCAESAVETDIEVTTRAFFKRDSLGIRILCIIGLRFGLSKLHCLWVPFDDSTSIKTNVAQERGSSGAETEGGVLNGLLACANGIEEV